MKKLVDGERWNDRWFRHQDRVDKVLMCWLWDHADCGGFVELDLGDVEDDLGLSSEKSLEGLARVTNSSEQLGTVRKSSKEFGTVAKSSEQFQKIYMAEYEGRPDKRWIWIASYVKVQVGLSDLRNKGGGPVIGMLRRMKEMEELFPAVSKTYKGFARVPKSSQEFLTVRKGSEPSIQNNTISKSKREGESERENVRDHLKPVEMVGDYEMKHEDPLYEKLLSNGLGITWIAWLELRKAYPDNDIDWEEVVKYIVGGHVNSSTGGCNDVWKYLTNLCKGTNFMKRGGKGKRGHTDGSGKRTRGGLVKPGDLNEHDRRRSEITEQFMNKEIDEAECTRLHRENDEENGS